MFSGELSKLNKGVIMISVFPNSLRFCRGHSAAYGVLRKVFAGFLSFISFICAAFAQTYSDYYFIPTSGNNNKLNDVGNYNVGSISGEPARLCRISMRMSSLRRIPTAIRQIQTMPISTPAMWFSKSGIPERDQTARGFF